MSKPGKLEVHEHSIISGPRALKSWCNKIVHSHEGGNVPHRHDETGPASYTIDKDEWRRATGLRGGGRKKFTAKPTGERRPVVAIPADELTYDVIIVGPPSIVATGPGDAIFHKLHQAAGLRPRSVRRAG